PTSRTAGQFPHGNAQARIAPPHAETKTLLAFSPPCELWKSQIELLTAMGTGGRPVRSMLGRYWNDRGRPALIDPLGSRALDSHISLETTERCRPRRMASARRSRIPVGRDYAAP